jgi:hypothetical protein
VEIGLEINAGLLEFQTGKSKTPHVTLSAVNARPNGGKQEMTAGSWDIGNRPQGRVEESKGRISLILSRLLI